MNIAESKHDQRMNELLHTAKILFYKKGYEMTTIQDILNEAGIAKGTFYHYFRSKEDLLDKLVDLFNKATFSKVEQIRSEGISPIDKFEKVFRTIRDIKVENIELMITLLNFMYDDKNILLKRKIDKSFVDFLTPILTSIIDEGRSSGVFHTFDPLISAELILSLFIKYGEIIGPMWNELSNNSDIINGIEKRLAASVNASERILGIPENTLNVVDEDVINHFKNKSINKNK